MTRPGGYTGRFLNVELSRGEIAEESFHESLLRSYIGGYGLGAALLYDRIPAHAEPLGPDNILGFITGPLTGTPSLLASRYTVVAKSPLSGGWGDANSGGRFGPALKFAGYDGILVRGWAQQAVYLLVDRGRASLLPAADLWGLDTVQTQDALRARHGKQAEIACIGPAGERLARIACVVTDGGRTAGRSGLGAVMGCKRLKAIVALGDAPPAMADPERVKTLREKYLPMIQGAAAQVLHDYGTSGFTQALIKDGRTPIKNWRGSYPADFGRPEAVDGPALKPFEIRKYACWGCPVACGAILRWDRDGQGYEGHRPEYETLASLGTYCGIEDLAAITTLNEICNRSGLDTISAGAVIAFAMECYERGLLTPRDLDGLELSWGSGEAAITLLNRIVRREGVGDLLAEGVWQASQRIGGGSETFAMHAGGQELPAHDPRHMAALGLMYQMSPTPGRHSQGGAYGVDLPPEQLAPFGLDPQEQGQDPLLWKARTYVVYTAWWNVLQAAGLCYFGPSFFGPPYVPEFLAAVTGWDLDMAECLRTGERIEVMRHLFNLRHGHNPLHVQVAPRALGHPPLDAGPVAGVTVELDGMRSALLQILDWDPVTSMPSQERLRLLGLDRLPIDGGP